MGNIKIDLQTLQVELTKKRFESCYQGTYRKGSEKTKKENKEKTN